MPWPPPRRWPPPCTIRTARRRRWIEYARERRVVATGQLLPYADRATPGDEAWAAGLAEAAADGARARAWLRSASMLDMPGFRARVAAPGLPA